MRTNRLNFFNLDFVGKLSADEVINYRATRFEDATHGKVVLRVVG